MKPIRHPRTRRLLAAALAVPALLTAQHASAALVVNFGSNAYVDDPGSGNLNVALQSSQGVFVDVGSPTTVSPDPSSTAYNGDGPGADNSRFYGGYGLFGGGNRFLGTSVITANPGSVSDTIRIQAGNSNNGQPNDLVFLQLFDNDDFLNGGDNSFVSLDSTSSFSAAASGNNNSGTRELRFVVKQGGSFYVSNDFTYNNPNFNLPGTQDFDDLSWFEYDPASSLLYTSGTAEFTGTFDDVEALGVYVTAGRPGTGTGAGGLLRLHYRSFSVNATLTPIPEPGSLALLGLAGLALLPRRRRD
ncbi:MAG: PEP-CTERM sorting domain-containing protein [Planctomycetota bacterium]